MRRILDLEGTMTDLRYDAHFAIRVKTHLQPPPGVIDGEALKPTFRGARRELLELHAALSRVLTQFGYAMDLDSLRGNLRTSVGGPTDFSKIPFQEPSGTIIQGSEVGGAPPTV
jgi:hypothetical protein